MYNPESIEYKLFFDLIFIVDLARGIAIIILCFRCDF
jgi:hypothetical protein